ncbi:MAG: hypothetical protein CVV35_00335 [Methanomicrobiales archaeon HGW-Methanomicrobiales-6]|jgi:hypothetical protein|nr:MAG: hypothetical protein CVV35_00335 [Methanomicrobiales archaeon HGW-Methanomicrobiales-6]
MAEFKNDLQKLVESTTDSSGFMRIRIISPGWGSSGYYSPEVLKAAAPLYKQGTHCYWNHPSRTEERDRPERDLRDLAGVLAEDAQWSNSPEPGLYARAQVFAPYRAAIKEMAPHIGISHYAGGESKQGEAEGRRGDIITQITYVRSVDFVTVAGRGGAILESARAEVAERVARSGMQRNAAIALYEGFKDLGLSDREAAAAALGRDHPAKNLSEGVFIADLDEAGREMYGGFRSMGLSEAEARAAAIRRDGPTFAMQETRDLDEQEKRLYDGFRKMGLGESAAMAAVRGRSL